LVKAKTLEKASRLLSQEQQDELERMMSSNLRNGLNHCFDSIFDKSEPAEAREVPPSRTGFTFPRAVSRESAHVVDPVPGPAHYVIPGFGPKKTFSKKNKQ
jgi:hypothetical protein